MKILQLIDVYRTGGAERVYDLFSQFCVSKGHAINRLVLYGKASENSAVKYLVSNEHSSLLLKVLDQIAAIRLIYRAVKISSIDHIVSFLDRSNIAIITAFLFDRKRPKITVTIHNPPSIQYLKLNKYIRPVFFLVLSWMYNRAWIKVIAVSQSVKESLRSIGTKKIYVVHNPLEIQIKSIGINRINNTEKFILAIGRLEPQKAHWKLIKAFYYYKKTFKDNTLKLYIAGTGQLESKLKELCREFEISNSVVFLGYKNNIMDYIHQSEFIVFSSFYEGFPVVLLECMALKKPFIGSESSIPVELRNILAGNNIINTYQTTNQSIDFNCDTINDDEKNLAVLINKVQVDKSFSGDISAICENWFLNNCSINNFDNYFI